MEIEKYISKNDNDLQRASTRKYHVTFKLICKAYIKLLINKTLWKEILHNEASFYGNISRVYRMASSHFRYNNNYSPYI